MPSQISSSLIAMRRKPQQARAKHAVESIVQAANELLGEQGLDALTTSRIAERAGVSVGTLYEYFPNRESILAQINQNNFEQEARQAQQAYRSNLDLPLETLFREIYTRMVEVDRRMLAQVGPLHRQQAQLLEIGRYAPERELNATEMLEGMQSILEAHGDEVSCVSLPLASQFLARGIRALVRNLLEDQPELLDDPELIPTLLRICSAIVHQDNPKP